MKANLFRAAVSSTIALLQVGCTSTVPNDLKLVSVEAIDYFNQRELPNPYVAQGFWGINDGRSPVQSSRIERPHELLLLAKISTATNLSQLPYSNTLGVRSHFCDRPDVYTNLNFPNVFLQGRDVREGPINVDPEAETSGRLFTYDMYFRSALRSPISRPQQIDFDLKQTPEDICFVLVGGAYRDLGYVSNTVTIPRGEIGEALATGGEHKN